MLPLSNSEYEAMRRADEFYSWDEMPSSVTDLHPPVELKHETLDDMPVSNPPAELSNAAFKRFKAHLRPHQEQDELGDHDSEATLTDLIQTLFTQAGQVR